MACSFLTVSSYLQGLEIWLLTTYLMSELRFLSTISTTDSQYHTTDIRADQGSPVLKV